MRWDTLFLEMAFKKGRLKWLGAGQCSLGRWVKSAKAWSVSPWCIFLLQHKVWSLWWNTSLICGINIFLQFLFTIFISTCITIISKWLPGKNVSSMYLSSFPSRSSSTRKARTSSPKKWTLDCLAILVVGLYHCNYNIPYFSGYSLWNGAEPYLARQREARN